MELRRGADEIGYPVPVQNRAQRCVVVAHGGRDRKARSCSQGTQMLVQVVPGCVVAALPTSRKPVFMMCGCFKSHSGVIAYIDNADQ